MSDLHVQLASQTEGVAEALSQVAAEGNSFLSGDSAAREKLISSARKLITAAETPVETLLWNIWALVR
jgi:hypothetical protein